jgi:TetR/AcrR family transcriptional regulator, transcriptional repressor for nem operon
MHKGERTRARIVARAAELFNTRGYGGTAISDVMQAAAIEKGGLYRHFASKEELAVAAFDYAVEQVCARLAPVFHARSNAADTLIAFIATLRTYASNPPLAGGCPILNTAIDSDDAQPVLRVRVRQALNAWQAELRRIVRDGIARGELQPTVDADHVAALLIATMEGALMMSRILDDAAPLHGAYSHLAVYIDTLRRCPSV